MIFFNNCDIRFNGSGLMAEKISLSSDNSLLPIRPLGKKSQTSIEPNGAIVSKLNVSYVVEIGKDIGHFELNKAKFTTGFENLTPITVVAAGISGGFYLQSYKIDIRPNEIVKADASYISYEPLSGQISQKPNSLTYASGFSGLAHFWTTEIHSDSGKVSMPIFDFSYSFEANLEPIYVLGRKYPKQILLISSEEEATITKDQYKPIDFYGLSGCLELGDCISNPRIRLYKLEKICNNNTGEYIEINMSGASVHSSNLSVDTNDFAKAEITMRRYN